jgi:hypothetical protein
MNAISSSGTSEFPSEGLLSTSGSYLVLVGDREIQYKLLGKMVLRNHSNSADCDILICCRLHRHQCPHEVGQTLLLSLTASVRVTPVLMMRPSMCRARALKIGKLKWSIMIQCFGYYLCLIISIHLVKTTSDMCMQLESGHPDL